MKKVFVIMLTGLMIIGTMGCATENKNEFVVAEHESVEAISEEALNAVTEEKSTEVVTEAS